jgi:hypothetical protein
MSLHQDFMYVAEKDAEIERLEEECLALENKVIALKAALRDCAVLMEYDLDYTRVARTDTRQNVVSRARELSR